MKLLIGGLLCLLLGTTQAQELPRLWDVDVVPVYHNPANNEVPVWYVEQTIKKVIAQWNWEIEHTQFEYRGETDKGSVVSGVVVSHIPLEGMNGLALINGMSNETYYSIHDVRIWMSTIHRRSSGRCWHSTLLHEFGHALGARHTSERGNVMYYSSGCRTHLTEHDISLVKEFPLPELLPEEEPPEEKPEEEPPEEKPEEEPPEEKPEEPPVQEHCPAELQDNNDLYFPAVFDGERTVEAYLSYTRINSKDMWEITEVTDTNVLCEPLAADDSGVIIYATRNGIEYKAWLQQVGPITFELAKVEEYEK